MIIDIFTHMAPQPYLDFLNSRGNASIRDKVARVMEIASDRPQAIHVKKRVEYLDQYGIDKQVITLVHMLDSNVVVDDNAEKLEIARKINDAMARVMEESGGKLVGAASVPLDLLDKGGLQEMDRAIKTLGLKAVALSTHLKGKPLDSPEYRAFWSHAVELDVPVYIHPTNPVSKEGRTYEADFDITHIFGWPFETTIVLTRLVMSGIMEELPKLKVISHHLGGGMIPFLFGRIGESYTDKIQLKTAGRILPRPPAEYFRLFYYDTAVGGSAASIKLASEIMGADQVVFATDFPHGPNGGLDRLRTYPGVIRSLDIPEADKNKILGGNAARILNL
ncbi:MAG: amidohydrolase family protein [Dehalococcoidia bacterium]|nr:amidohydrolase family protein [Dehalococcoidia bacterium]